MNLKVQNIEESIRRKKIRNDKWIKVKKMKLLYLFLFFPLAFTVIFNYVPMYGVQIAFKDFIAGDGIWASKWNNFEHFRMLFQAPGFYRVMKNTLIISFLRIIFGFAPPIIMALLLNEIMHLRFKKIVQTITYLPHFMSWVILAGVFLEVFSVQRGVANKILALFGHEPINFLLSNTYFVPILIITAIWQSVGWGAIIYIATLAAVNPELYESANLDGANRWQKAIYISIPSISNVISILFIMGFSGILSAGFDQIFNMYNPLVLDTADILDTFVYRMGFENLRYDFATAVGLFKNVVGLLLMFLANQVLKRTTEFTIWGGKMN